MTHTSESSSSKLNHESSSITTSKSIEKERFILPPISSMDSFYQSRSWPPPATTIPTSASNNNNNSLVSPASNSSYMSMQETLLSPPLPVPRDSSYESSWNNSNNTPTNRSSIINDNHHPHNQPRPDYFITNNSSSSVTAAATTPNSYYSSTSLSSMDRDDSTRYQGYSSNDHLIHRDHHYRQNSLPQLSSFRKNSINSIISQQQSSTTTTIQNQPVFRYQPNKNNSNSNPTSSSPTFISNYAATSVNNMLSPPSLSSTSTTPSLRNIENDIDEVIKHCNTLTDNMNQRRGSIVENDNYFSNPTLMRPWLDDMIGRANEVLNALLRLRKHQLAAEHARLHKSSDQHLQRGLEDEVNWDGTSNTMTSSSGLMTLNSVRQKKRGKRPTFQNRCHSCNISETPEWRRGPDGARTLCNACGLHYAKLAKKVKQEDEAKKEMIEDKDDTSMK